MGFVEGARSGLGVGDDFGASASCAIKLMDRRHRMGSAAPGKRGGSAGKLKLDMAMPELAEALKAQTGIEAAPASLSRFLIRDGLRFKKNIGGQRTESSRRRATAQ